MSIEFKAPLSMLDGERYSRQSVGLYQVGRFMQDPLGRHDASVEIWSAPARYDGTGTWRSEQRCLAISTQMACTVPASVNFGKGKL